MEKTEVTIFFLVFAVIAGCFKLTDSLSHGQASVFRDISYHPLRGKSRSIAREQ